MGLWVFGFGALVWGDGLVVGVGCVGVSGCVGAVYTLEWTYTKEEIVTLPFAVKVPLPDSGIWVRRASKYKYVYKVLETYRNAKGQPTNKARSIGRLDPASGMLIPNNAYYEYYGPPASGEPSVGSGMLEVLPESDSVRSVGAVFLVRRVLDDLGVSAILKKTLGAARAEMVLMVAAYMARRGNVMDHLPDWCLTSTLGPSVLSPQDASRLFASITPQEKMAFFRAWVAAQPSLGYLAYDVTSMSTYAKGIEDAEWGYNRDGEKLPQINLGCYLAQDSGLPVFYATYPGSITDVAHLGHMTAHNQDLGIRGVTFILDRGFASTKNIGHMHEEKLEFIIGAPISTKAIRQAIEPHRQTIVVMRNRTSQGVYAVSSQGRFYGTTNTLHIYHDPILAEHQRADLHRVVEKHSEELAQSDQLTKQDAKHYSRFHTIDLSADGTFTYQPDQDKIDAAAHNAGIFCLLTNTPHDSQTLLGIYRRKDILEKGFDELKNHTGMKRLRTHYTDTTNGKLFAAFISLIAVCHLQRQLADLLADNRISKKGMLAEMDKIKIVYAPQGRRLINPATKTQRDILHTLNLQETDLQTYAAPPTP